MRYFQIVDNYNITEKIVSENYLKKNDGILARQFLNMGKAKPGEIIYAGFGGFMVIEIEKYGYINPKELKL